jgi:hypothetical protein
MNTFQAFVQRVPFDISEAETELMEGRGGYEHRAAISPTEAWEILNSGESVELLMCKVMESLEDGLFW